MFYSKWTFSLTSLVVMLALAFVVPSAMGQFAVTFNADDADVSYADGIQANGEITGLKIKFDKVVQLAATPDTAAAAVTTFELADLKIVAYNSFGGTETAPTLSTLAAATPADGQNFTVTVPAPGTAVTRVILYIDKEVVELADPRAEIGDDGKRKAEGKNKAGNIEIHYVAVETADAGGTDVDERDPRVLSIVRPGDVLRPVTEATVDVVITLSEEPRKDGFKKDHIDVSNATAADPVALDPVRDPAAFTEAGVLNGLTDGADRGMSTGRDGMHHRYVVTITPKYENKDDIVVKVKMFYDQEKMEERKYTPPTREADYTEGMDKLTIKVGKEVLKDQTAGFEVLIPKEIRFIKDGYLVIATNLGESGVKDNPENDKDEPKSSARTPAELMYNAITIDTLPNLETFLANGGTIDVVGPKKVVISEIMWGSDASLSPNNNSQWIELKNKSGESFLTAEKEYKLVFYGPNETPPAKVAVAAVAETATTKAQPAGMALPEGVMDRVGTIDAKGAYWSIIGKGQSGRSGEGESQKELVAVVPTQAIVSMYRVADADGMPMDGQMASSWMQSTPPGVNFDLSKAGVRIGSPGAARLVTAAEAAAEAAAAKAKAEAAAAAAAKAADTSVSMPKVGQIYISEIMFAGGGTLPQWIEISNGSRTEQVNLSGWTLTVENATADADVSVGAKAVFTIPEGTKVDPSGQHDTPSTILVVTEQGRNNIDDGTAGAGQIINLWTDQQTELILLGVTKRRYSLLSDMAFQITLAPPVPIVAPAKKAAAPTTAAEIAAARAAEAAKKAADAKAALARKSATDVVGNLGADGAATWALPMNDGARSSIIRRHVPVSIGPAEPEDGSMMDSWALASDTSFAQVTHIRASSYYGSADDVGTPGFRAGGALPVELSHFRPARNKETGQVVITWSTQSELNNAGFFIKRSQQRTGEFVVINATMVPGAGTTSEKQFYTYTDTTAQPNVVYYYQIEDVSLDGNRQTLTRGIRLKGHIGAAGKATTTWGDLKTQE